MGEKPRTNEAGMLAANISSSDSKSRDAWLFGETWINPLNSDVDLTVEAQFAERARYAREKCRNAFIIPNPIFESGLQVKLAYTIGERASVGTLYDEEANNIVQNFVFVNDYNRLLKDRIVPEMLVDGEIFIIFDKEFSPTDPNVVSLDGQEIDVNVPLIGILNAPDVEAVNGNPIVGIRSITTNSFGGSVDGEYEKSEFSSWAFKANFGQLRGYPPFEGARQLADSMVEFINGRLTVNRINSRLNMLHTHLIYSETEANNTSVADQKNECMMSMQSIPEDGGIVHAFKDADTGMSEEISFLKTDKAATDARNDFEILRRQFAAAMGLADHMIGWGDSTNRSTAEVISESVIKNFQLFQQAVRDLTVDVVRKMLVRVNGPDKLYRQLINDPNLDGGTIEVEVTADRLNIPVELPDLQTDSLSEKIEFYQFAFDMGYPSQKILDELGLSNA